MSGLNDGPASAISAIRDVLMKNQDLKQKDLEARYGHYGQQPETPVENGAEETPIEPVETPDEPTDQ